VVRLIERRNVDTTTLTAELISGAEDFAEMQSVGTWTHCVRVLTVFILDVLHAIAKIFAGAEGAGVLMVEKSS